MLSIKRRILTATILTVFLVTVVLAQQVQPRPAATQDPIPVVAGIDEGQESQPRQSNPSAQSRPATTPRPEPQYVEEKGFKGKVFELKHRDPANLAMALKPLGSGFKGAVINFNQELETITVRDFPENIAAIEEAIKRLDVPEGAGVPQPDIEFVVHVMIASNADLPPGDFPTDLNPVIKQLQSTLRYKNYGLMTSSIHRAKERGKVTNSGVAESKLLNVATPQGNPVFYQYSLEQIMLDPATNASTRSQDRVSTSPRVQVGRFNFSMRIPLSFGGAVRYENVGFNTPVSVREGERVVVGTTSMGDKGLIVVLSAKVTR